MDEMMRKHLTKKLHVDGGRYCETTYEGLPVIVWYNQARTFGIYGMLIALLLVAFLILSWTYGLFVPTSLSAFDFAKYVSTLTGFSFNPILAACFLMTALFSWFALGFSFGYEYDDISYCFMAWHNGRVVVIFDIGLHNRIRGINKRKSHIVDLKNISEIINGSVIHWTNKPLAKTVDKKGTVFATNENFSCIVIKHTNDEGIIKAFVLKDYPVSDAINQMEVIEDLSFFESFLSHKRDYYTDILSPNEEVKETKIPVV